MVKKIKKLREAEEAAKENENNLVSENDDEMDAVREACKRIHEEADEIKEDDELNGVFGEIKESLDDIQESLDKLVNEDEDENLEEDEDEEKTLEEEVEEIKESLDKLVDFGKSVNEEDGDESTKLDEEEVEEIKESLDKLVDENVELELEDAKEIQKQLNSLAEDLEKIVDEEDEKKDSLEEDEDEEKLDESEEDSDKLEEDEEKETIEESVKRIFRKMKLSESTKKAVATLIEAKVKEEVEDQTKELEQKAEEYQDMLKKESDEELQQKLEELEDKADAYLSEVADEWVNENELAVEQGIKSEIAESIMTGIKKVLKENNINIPENKSNLLDETLDVNKRLQTKINEKLAVIAKLKEENASLLKYKLIEENSKDLSLAQKAKLTGLLENVNYKNENELVRKIRVLKENYISNAKSSINTNSVSRKLNSRSNDGIYDSYAKFIENSNK